MAELHDRWVTQWRLEPNSPTCPKLNSRTFPRLSVSPTPPNPAYDRHELIQMLKIVRRCRRKILTLWPAPLFLQCHLYSLASLISKWPSQEVMSYNSTWSFRLQSHAVVVTGGRNPLLCFSGLSGWVLRSLPYSQAALHAACMQLTA